MLLVVSAVFWSGFEQAGSSLSLFADRYTDRTVFGFAVPAGWFQALNPVFIITLAPVFASLWVRLARRHLDPSIPAKFAWGLVMLALGFLVMVAAARLATTGNKVLPTWLIHTIGEICLSPVGLSAVSKLAPARYVGQMMGLWFLATALGNLLAGLFAGSVSAESPAEISGLYLRIVWMAGGGVVLLLLVLPFLKRLMAENPR